ncbi:MAG: DUF3237 family protein [Acidimicrobiales bacterium]
MLDLTEFCTLDLVLKFIPIGSVPAGTRVDVPFEGTAKGRHWEGELPVSGLDAVTLRSDGNMALDLRGRIGTGRGVVSYHGTGLSIVPSRGVAEATELLQFETSDPSLAFLNCTVGVATGRGEGSRMHLSVYLLSDQSTPATPSHASLDTTAATR